MDLPAQHRHLMTQHQQLDILGAAVARELGQHLQDLPQQQVYQRRSMHPIITSDRRAVTDRTARQRALTDFTSGTGYARYVATVWTGC